MTGIFFLVEVRLRKLFAEKFALNAVESFGSLLVHFFGEAEVANADDVVAADFGSVGFKLFVGKIHFAERLKNAVEINFALAHGGVMVNRVIGFAATVEPRRIDDIAAVDSLIPRVSQKDVGQFVARIFEHVADVALALVVEEAMTRAVNVAEIFGAERFDNVASLVVEFAEVVRVRLNFHAQTFALDYRKKLFHGAEKHAVANFLLIGVAAEFGIDDGHAHVDGDFNNLFPVGDGVLTLLLGRTRPTINHDERRNFDAGFLESLAIFRLALLGEKRVLVKRINARVRGLFNIFVSPIGNLVDVIVDAHLFGEHVNIKSNLHFKPSFD